MQTSVTTWADAKKNPQQNQQDRIQFMKLLSGTNIVRVISNLGAYIYENLVLPGSKAAWGDRIRMSADPNDPVRKYFGRDGKERYILLVIDRRENEIKQLDCSPVIKDGLVDILETKNMQSEKTITPIDFDISIKKDSKAATPALVYAVHAFDNAPLLASDLALIEQFGDIDEKLQGCIKSPTPEQVERKMTNLAWVKP